MPRARRRANERREYDKVERRSFTDGITFTNRYAPLHRLRITKEEWRAAWDDLRDELVPEWIEAHPFSRPLGYWEVDADQPRLPVSGEAAIEAREWMEAHQHYRQYSFLWLNRRLGITDDSRDEKAPFESEKQYLIRLDLLTESERELL